MLVAWMFATIVIHHGRSRSGLLLMLVSTVLAGLGTVLWLRLPT